MHFPDSGPVRNGYYEWAYKAQASNFKAGEFGAFAF
jgi:hypothetical protein